MWSDISYSFQFLKIFIYLIFNYIWHSILSYQLYSTVVKHLYNYKVIPSIFSSINLTPYIVTTILFTIFSTLCVIPLLMQTLAHRVHVLWLWWTNSHGLQTSCGEKGMAWPVSQWERGPRPLPGQGFIAFLGTLHGGWSSFTTRHRFAIGDYLLQIIKERMFLITSKRRMLQIKGKSGWTSYTPNLGGLAEILGSYFKDMQ